MTRNELETKQLKKFRRLVKYIKKRSPYYAEVIHNRSIDSDSCRPEDFPLLTKRELMENFDRIVTDRRLKKEVVADFLTRSKDPNDLLLGRYHVVHTSGTSGELAYFVHSDKEWVVGGTQIARIGRRRQLEDKPRRGKLRGVFYGATEGHFTGVSLASSLKRIPMSFFFDVMLLEVNSPLTQIIEQLNVFQPQIVAGYTTALKILATKQRQGLLNIAPLAITTGGEALSQGDWGIIDRCIQVSGNQELRLYRASYDGGIQ